MGLPTSTVKKWFSIAIEMPQGIEIFRHFMTKEQSTKLWHYLHGKQKMGDVGLFAVVGDDNANPLTDEANQVVNSDDIVRMLTHLLPKGVPATEQYNNDPEDPLEDYSYSH